MNVELDPWTRRLRPTIVFGGSPARFVRLGEAGVAAMDEIETGDAGSKEATGLAERLIEAGMAHHRPAPAPSAATRTVSIVIPVYDRDVGGLVAGLRRTAPLIHEIIIVDDASPTDSSRRLDELAAATADVRVIRHETNRGPAAARNTGIAAVSTARVLCIDSDCVVPDTPGWLEVLLGHLESDRSGPRVAAVAPRIVAVGGDVENVTGQAAGRYDRAFCPLDMGSQRGLVGRDRRVRYVPTAALLVDLDAARDAASSNGAVFDPDLRCGEDVDFVWRLERRGRRVVYEPSVEVGHRALTSITGLIARRFAYGASAAQLDRRHRGAVSHLHVSPWAVLAAVGGVIGSAPMAGAAFAAQAASLDARLARAGLPNDELDRAVGTSLVQSGLGLGRYLNQFWWPVVVALALNGRVPTGVRGRLLAMCLGRSIEEAWRRDGSLVERVGLVAGRALDEAAYGAGVWRGALASRSLRVVLPRVGRWKPDDG